MINFLLEVSKIFMTTGKINGSEGTNITEIVDLNGNCTPVLPNYPKRLYWAVGEFINGTILICGGYRRASKMYKSIKSKVKL